MKHFILQLVLAVAIMSIISLLPEPISSLVMLFLAALTSTVLAKELTKLLLGEPNER